MEKKEMKKKSSKKECSICGISLEEYEGYEEDGKVLCDNCRSWD
jgi:formylmethanofuran dehydrogenase subunit E